VNRTARPATVLLVAALVVACSQSGPVQPGDLSLPSGDVAVHAIDRPVRDATPGLPVVWSKTYSNCQYGGVAVDARGNVFLATTCGGQSSPSVLLASFDRAGQARFSSTYPGCLVQRGPALDAAGNVFLTGGYPSPTTIGGGALPGCGVFLASFTGDGQHRFSKGFAAAGDSKSCVSQGRAVATDAEGSVYLTGMLRGEADLGGGATSTVSDESFDLLLAGFSGSGKYRFAQRVGGVGQALEPRGLAVDPAGDLHVAGFFIGTVDFGGGPLSSAGHYVFLAGFDASGQPRFSRSFAGASPGYGAPVAADRAGNSWLTGDLKQATDFGGGQLAGSAYLASFGPSGEHRLSRSFSGAGDGNALAVDRSGNVYVAGFFRDRIDLGGGPLVSPDARPESGDSYLASFSESGEHRFSGRLGDGTPVSLVVAEEGSVYLLSTKTEPLAPPQATILKVSPP
jgi:hypothetical protein